jgi:hypothetical protein
VHRIVVYCLSVCVVYLCGGEIIKYRWALSTKSGHVILGLGLVTWDHVTLRDQHLLINQGHQRLRRIAKKRRLLGVDTHKKKGQNIMPAHGIEPWILSFTPYLVGY